MSGGGPIDFYFEFSSPYGYIASQLVDDFAGRIGRPVRWRPMLLGPVFKITGQPPLIDIPMKGEYSRRDFARSARLHKVAYRHPEKFPVGTVAALRTFYWVNDRDPAQAKAFARAAYAAYFADGRDISAAPMVIEVAKECGVATQTGNQGRSSEGHRETIEWLRDGAIGAVREVHAWSGGPRMANGAAQAPRQGPSAKPTGLNWDLWLGPRAERPYDGKFAPFVWRNWYDFGGGTLPDMGLHNFDPAFNALGLDAPLTIEAVYSDVDRERSVGAHLVTWWFGATADHGPLPVRWYDGGLRPPVPLGADPDDPRQRLGEAGNGLLVVGEKGSLTAPGWSGMPRLLPYELHKAYQHPPKTLPRVENHHADWLQACMGGTPACSNFEYGARLTEFILLGVLAIRTGKTIKWDSATMTATNVPAAQAMIQEEYRKGWELPL